MVVINVVDVDRIRFSVCAARYDSRTGGLPGATNGGLWCWPVAKTSQPACSACFAILTVSFIRWFSDGAFPVCGSGVTSQIVKIPNCIRFPLIKYFNSELPKV